MDWLGLHVTLFTHYIMITCSREWGVTVNTQELSHEGLSSPIAEDVVLYAIHAVTS
jgi:hypothetical protein